MKNPALLNAVIPALLVLLMGCGGTSEFGKPLTIEQPTTIAQIMADPAAYKGKRVLVEGTITEVCEMMGCWIMIQSADGRDAIRFKVDDGVIEFPMSVKGKTARAEGVVSVKELSVDEQIAEGEHHADETGGKFDPATVTGTKTRIQLNGEGAVVR